MNRARVTRVKKTGKIPEKRSHVEKKGVVGKSRDSDFSNLTDGSEEEEKEEDCLVNPNLHLNSDVPESVQDFIRSISRSGLSDDKKDSSSKTSSEEKSKKNVRGRRPCAKNPAPPEVDMRRKPSVEVIIVSTTIPITFTTILITTTTIIIIIIAQVIITSEYEPDKLSNREYDRLKKVQKLKPS